MKTVGKSVSRVDAVAKVTGQAKYVDDLYLPGMLYAKVHRSPHAHARIARMDVEKARSLSGIRAVISGDEAPDNCITFMNSAQWCDKVLFAREKVRYVGEEVAAVVGLTPEVCTQAIRLIEVDYEPLPGVFSVSEALAKNAPLVHEHVKQNIVDRFIREEGNVSRALEEADLIVEETYSTPAISACALEPHGAVAQFVGDKLNLWTSTQTPYYVKKDLSLVTGIAFANIRIHELSVGGGFGSKTRINESDLICVLLAKMTGRPVKLILTREEMLTATRTRYPHQIYLKTGVKRDGTITAWDARILIDNGAYNCLGHLFGNIEGARLSSLYPAPTRVEATPVYTNHPPGGQVRAYGNVQINFAIESQMDEIARRLGIDRLHIRLKNSVRAGQKTYWGWKISSCGLQECLEKTSSAMGYPEPAREPNTGIGLAAMTHRSSGGKQDFSAAFVKVTDGEAVVFSGATDIGQGSSTILCQIAAEFLSLPFEDVRAVTMDTDLTPLDMGSRANRVTFMAGLAVKAAAEDAREQILEKASKYLDQPRDLLTLEQGVVFCTDDPQIRVSIKELTSTKEPKGGSAILGKGSYENPVERGQETYVYGCQGIKVRVDQETGRVELMRIVASQDVGRAINPQLVEGQIEGGVVQGIGTSLWEELDRRDGVTMSDNLRDYRIPTFPDVPRVETLIVESDEPYGPLGAKGAGEPPIAPTSPAVANAICDAIGVRITSLPLTPEKVLAALEEKKKR